MFMSIEILGVRVDGFSLIETLKKMVTAWGRGKPFLIFTPNPEMLLKANSDQYFKTVLNAADVTLCDGFGSYLVARSKGARINRVTGVDFFLALVRLAAKAKKRIFLLGSGDDKILYTTARNLLEKHSDLMICGLDKGPVVTENREQKLVIGTVDSENLKKKLEAARPDILVVAFGNGKQEKWIYENADKIPGLKVAIGVGGAFDYLGGKVPRAPLLMRKIGIEWLYRLYKDPRRFKRILNATVVFMYLVFKDVWDTRKLKNINQKSE